MSSTELSLQNIPSRYYTAWRMSKNKLFQNSTTTGMDTKIFIIEIKMAEALNI